MVAGDLFGPRRVRVYRGAPQPTPEPAPAPSPGPAPSPQPVTDPGKAIEGEIVDR